MSKACTSPTARLLQTSRLFSLPKPLPAPPAPVGNNQRHSETSTKPYPLHQAIETPYTSQVIGEWGLKRHLPLRTTAKRSTPLRILAQDTNDHITDFASAGDHTMSLHKFQEMSVPVLRPMSRTSAFGVKKYESVYDEAVDTTDRTAQGVRWKNHGPFLATLNEGDLEQFLQQVKQQRPEFDEFLRVYFTTREFAVAKKAALQEKGYFGPKELQNLVVQRDIIVTEAEESIRKLQEDSESTEVDIENIRQDARQQALEIEAAIDVQTRNLRAIEDLAAADKRVRGILADSRVGKQKELDRLPQEEVIERYNTNKKDARLITRNACIELLVRFDQDFDSEDDVAIEQAARAQAAKIQAQINEDEDKRIAQLQKWENEAKEPYVPNAERFSEMTKQLRDEHRTAKLSSQLTTILVQFLDLPGLGDADARITSINKTTSAATMARTTAEMLHKEGMLESSELTTPPTTHPGAGLGYLRSLAHMKNHPFYGPQASHSPILSRVVRPRKSATGTEFHAKIGIGGFVAMDSKGTNVNNETRHALQKDDDPDRFAVTLDPYREGGNKMYMTAGWAEVDASGRVVMKLTRPDKEALAVKTGNVADILRQKEEATNGPSLGEGLPKSWFSFPESSRPREGGLGTSLPNYQQSSQ